jgi:membrane protein
MAEGNSPAKDVSRLVRAIDRAQQDRSWLAIVVATWKKFGDDQAGNLAALVAYYAFASLFPLLLVAYTILDLVARTSPTVAARLRNALSQYPFVRDIGLSHGIRAAGLALVIGFLLTLYASLGVASAIQNAMNTAWSVPKYDRPGFPKNKLRSLGLVVVLGPGEVLTIALSTIAGGAGHLGGAAGETAAAVVALLLNIGLFYLIFRMATARVVRSRDLRLGAILAAIAWQILQLLVGRGIVRLHSNSAYGQFAVVLALLAWFYLQAQITLYLVELDVVRARRLWPRSLAPPPLTHADVRAYQAYAEASQPRREVRVTVDQVPPQRAESGSTAGAKSGGTAGDQSGDTAGSAPGAAHPATAVDAAANRQDDRPTS